MPEPKYPAEHEEWYWFSECEVYAQYASRIVNGILFHSILFNNTYSGPTWASNHALGSKASRGCIRLRVPEEGLNWSKIECEGLTGWTDSNYIEIVKWDDAP